MEIDIDNVKEIKFGEVKEIDNKGNAYRIAEIIREGEKVEITFSGKKENLIFKL